MTEASDAGAGSSAPMSERMQALLSRAVEDQLSEQRQLTTALNELRALLVRTPQDVQHAVAAATSSQESRFASDLEGLAHELRGGLRALGERLDGLAHTVQEIGSRESGSGGAVAAELNGVRVALHNHGATLAALQSGFESLPAFPDQVAGVQDEIRALAKRLDTIGELQASVGEAAGRLTALESLAGDVRGARAAAERAAGTDVAAGVASALSPLSQRIQDLEAAVGRQSERLEQLGAQDHDELLSRLDLLFDRLEALDARVTELSDRDPTAALRGTLDEIRVAVSAQSGDDSATGDELRGLRSDLGLVQGLLGGDAGIVADVSAVRHELGQLRAHVEQARGGVDEQTVADAVRRAVAESTAQTEQRLAAHVDEAVLALAEALLRRRTPRPVSAPAPEPAAGPADLPLEDPVAQVSRVAEGADETAPGDDVALTTTPH